MAFQICEAEREREIDTRRLHRTFRTGKSLESRPRSDDVSSVSYQPDSYTSGSQARIHTATAHLAHWWTNTPQIAIYSKCLTS